MAAANCGPREKVIQHLDKKFQEKRRAFGIVGPDRVAEVYVSKSGTWTVVISTAQGLACIIAAGQDWEDIEPDFQTGSGI